MPIVPPSVFMQTSFEAFLMKRWTSRRSTHADPGRIW